MKHWLLQSQSAGAPWAACRLDGWTIEPGLHPDETSPNARVGFVGRLVEPLGRMMQQANMRPANAQWVPGQVDAPTEPGSAGEGDLAADTHEMVASTRALLASEDTALVAPSGAPASAMVRPLRGSVLTNPLGARIHARPMGASAAPVMFVPGPTVADAIRQFDELLPPPAWMTGGAA